MKKSRSQGRRVVYVGRPRGLPTLRRALGVAPSKAALARALEISPSTLRRWLERGLPPGVPAAQVVAATKELRAVQKERQRQQRQIEQRRARQAKEAERSLRWRNFRRLLRQAKSELRIDQHPTRQGKRLGALTVGYSWTRSYEKELTQDVILSVRRWVSSLSKKRKFPLWQVVVFVSQFGTDEPVGSRPVLLQLDTSLSEGIAPDVTVGGVVSKNLSSSLARAIGDLEEALESSLLAWVHAVTVNNYRRRSEQQRREFESRERYRRAAEEANKAKKKGQRRGRSRR